MAGDAQTGSHLNGSDVEHAPRPDILWESPNPKETELFKFILHVNKKFAKTFQTYDDLYRWSITDIASFWNEVWDYSGIVGSKSYNVSINLFRSQV
jgi:hypothetical protein